MSVGNAPGSSPSNPNHPCTACGTNNWWLRAGAWLCGTCHPDPKNMKPTTHLYVNNKGKVCKE